MVKIVSVELDSLAALAGIRADDALKSINGNPVRDAFDYRYYLTESSVALALVRDGEEYTVTIEKDEYDDIGLSFETPLMDAKQSCRNKCIFCFIDQLPKGLRNSLYFKDDDSRLSFLHGNYITLTNLTDGDVDRIIKMHLSPINVSVHTTNPTLRCKMMNNRFAGDCLRFLDRLKAGGATLNAQIVLCRGINDGAELERTLRDLAGYYPALESISVVPAGLTKFRDGLYPLTDYTRQECNGIIDTVERFADEFYSTHGTRLVWCSDELYLRAGRDVHGDEYYEDYIQYNNGVGMLTSFCCDVNEELDYPEDHVHEFSKAPRHVSVATGVAAYPTVKAMADKLCAAYEGLRVDVYPIVNDFFGHSVTVTGLLTGRDIYEQLKDKPLGEELLLSSNTVNSDGELFLCGMTPQELSELLGVQVTFADEGEGGRGFVSAVLGENQK